MKKCLFLLLLVPLLCNCGYFKKPFPLDEQVFDKDTLAVIPLQYNPDAEGTHDLNARINVTIDSMRQSLVLGLGYAGTSISLHPSTLAKYHHTFNGVTVNQANIKREKIKLREFILPRVLFGDLAITNLKGLESPEPPAGMEGTTGEVLGLDFLKQFNVLIDYRDKQLVLYKKGYLPPLEAKWTRVKFETHYDQGIILPVFVPELKKIYHCVLITANPPRDDQGRLFGLVRQDSGLGKDLLKSGLTTGAGDLPEYTGDLDLASLKLHNINFKIIDYKLPEYDGMLFYPIMADHPLFIDFAHNNIYIEK